MGCRCEAGCAGGDLRASAAGMPAAGRSRGVLKLLGMRPARVRLLGGSLRPALRLELRPALRLELRLELCQRLWVCGWVLAREKDAAG